MKDDLEAFTVQEILAELRGRERAVAARPRAKDTKAARAPRAAAPAVVPKFRSLSHVASGDLAKALNNRQRAIYGTDDRKEIVDVSDRKALALANASVALVEAADLQATRDGHWKLKTSSYEDDYQLCSSEPFVKQPLGCFCSGVLVAPDVVATAGHCVKSTSDLKHVRFVFGFRMVNAKKAHTTFADKDVYKGREVIGRRLTADGTDWALVRLDRPVVGRRPVPFRTSGRVGNDEPLFVIGHPCGLPQKMAGGAAVRNNEPSTHFVANLDTYGGNSGSPVFSARSYRLEGLLVRGQKDFVKAGSCYVSMVFPTTGAGGEDVTRSTEWASRVTAAHERSVTRTGSIAADVAKTRPRRRAATKSSPKARRAR